jgi:manganese-transporting P-type ATPase
VWSEFQPSIYEFSLTDAANSPSNPRKLVNVKDTSRDTTLCLAAAHALVKLDDGTIVGDPMEKTTLDSLEWTIGKGDFLAPTKPDAPHKTIITIKRRFQFSSALKRMSTISALPNGGLVVSVKGAPETIKGMLEHVPEGYDDTYKWFTRNGSRVLALGMKEMQPMNLDKVSRLAGCGLWAESDWLLCQINKLPRTDVESSLRFAGFLVFHCPLKADAIESLKMLADSSHRVSLAVLSRRFLSCSTSDLQCIMITGDNPLTAIHVARDVEIVDRDVLILDMAEEPKHDRGESARSCSTSACVLTCC